MFSLQQVSKSTALALALGAMAAPAASAMPIGGIPARPTLSTSANRDPQPVNPLAEARALKATNPLFYRNVSVRRLETQLAGPPVYSRQDKQVVPSSPTPVSSPASSPRSATPSGGFEWAYVGVGGGALAISLFGIGGAFAISQRRTRRTAALAATS